MKMKLVSSLRFILLSSIVRIAYSQTESCAQWELHRDVMGFRGFFQPHVATEDVCKTTCMAFPDCESIDWIQSDDRKCHHYYTGGTRELFNRTGSNKWRIKRIAACKVDCVFAMRARENANHAESGELVPSDNKLFQCTRTCLYRVNCFGFDFWSSNDTGKRCSIKFESKYEPSWSAASISFRIGRPGCTESAKTGQNETEPAETLQNATEPANTRQNGTARIADIYGKSLVIIKSGLKSIRSKPVNESDIYEESLVIIKSQLQSRRFEPGFCLEWSLLSNTKMWSGAFRQHVTTEETCKIQCIMAYPRCLSVDWTGSRECFHSSVREIETKSYQGSSHWNLTANACAKGLCLEFKRTINFIESNGIINEDVDSEDMCKMKCVAMYPECRSFDWTITVNEKKITVVQCHHHFHPPTNQGITSPGAVHWLLVNVTCEERKGTSGLKNEDCGDAFRTQEDKEPAVSQSPSKTAGSINECKKECVATGGCYGFYWNSSRRAASGEKCFPHLNGGPEMRSKTGTTYYEFVPPLCKEPTKTASSSTGPCAEWISVPGARVAQGVLQPHISTVEKCKETCEAFPNCEAIDWMPEGNQSICHLHDGYKTSMPIPHARSNYMKLYRDRECKVSCFHALRAKDLSQVNRSVGLDGEVQRYANGLSQCMKACLARSRCRGFDWMETNDEGERCTLQFVGYGITKPSNESTFYEIGRPWCTESTPTTNPAIDECVDAFRVKENSELSKAGERYGDAGTVVECKKVCLEREECVGFDWSNSKPDRQRCVLQFGFNDNIISSENSTHYQVLPGSACRSSCIEWTMLSGFKREKGSIQNDDNEISCKMKCLKTLPKCEAIDWTPDKKPPCTHHYVGESEKLINQQGAVHWTIKLVPCTGSCTVWSRFPNIEVKPSVHQPAYLTEEKCKMMCMKAYPGCQSIDWAPQRGGLCFHHFNGITTKNESVPGSVHWKLNTQQCEGSCSKWTLTYDTTAKDGVFHPDISSEDMCKIACSVNVTCRSIDWISTAEQNCLLHYGDDSKVPTWGAVHWDLTPNKTCEAISTTTTTTTTTMMPVTVYRQKESGSSGNSGNDGGGKEEAPQNEGSGSSTLAILGITFGVLVAVALVGLYVRFRLERRKATKSGEGTKLLTKPETTKPPPPKPPPPKPPPAAKKPEPPRNITRHNIKGTNRPQKDTKRDTESLEPTPIKRTSKRSKLNTTASTLNLKSTTLSTLELKESNENDNQGKKWTLMRKKPSLEKRIARKTNDTEAENSR